VDDGLRKKTQETANQLFGKGVKMDVPSGCYIAGALTYAQSASLMFAEPGTYSYAIQFKVGRKSTGTIVVK
jgi:hypothetical protein